MLAGMQYLVLGLQNCLRLYRLYSGFIAFSISECKSGDFIKQQCATSSTKSPKSMVALIATLFLLHGGIYYVLHTYRKLSD